MLTKTQMNENQNRYVELIKSIKIEGANIDGFLNWITNKSDFFTAPASTKYHCHYEGGLCEHSLNVYDNLVKLVETFGVKDYSQDTLKIVSLCHDLSKANFYEQYMRNVNTGVKDEKGKDIWEKVPEYKVREAENRFVYGSHEQNAEFIAHQFFPLTLQESAAILHHHGGQSWDSAQDDIPTVFNTYELAVLLHMADVMSTFITENEKV